MQMNFRWSYNEYIFWAADIDLFEVVQKYSMVAGKL